MTFETASFIIIYFNIPGTLLVDYHLSGRSFIIAPPHSLPEEILRIKCHSGLQASASLTGDADGEVIFRDNLK